MSDDFLSRWSRRKHAARRGEPGPEATPDRPTADPAPASAGVPSSASLSKTSEVPGTEAPLPAVESLTPESDFSPFMRSDVDPGLRRQALRTLFRDPRFNVMDGLDVYIDDYSKPDPIPAEWLGKLNQLARLGDYPAREARERASAQAEEQRREGPIPPQDQGISVSETSDTSATDTTPPQARES